MAYPISRPYAVSSTICGDGHKGHDQIAPSCRLGLQDTRGFQSGWRNILSDRFSEIGFDFWSMSKQWVRSPWKGDDESKDIRFRPVAVISTSQIDIVDHVSQLDSDHAHCERVLHALPFTPISPHRNRDHLDRRYGSPGFTHRVVAMSLLRQVVPWLVAIPS